MRPLGRATLILAIGHALAGAAYLALINTPDANVLMLGVSLALVVLAIVVVLATSTLATRAVAGGLGDQRGWRGTLALIPAAALTMTVAGALCWLAGSGEAWWMAHRGEVDAAAIAAGDITRTDWLHAAVRWTVALVQWVIVPCWIAAGLAWGTTYGTRHVASLKWLVAGLSPRLLLTALLAIVVLVWIPWRVVYWRPASITSSVVEMTFTAIKLGALVLAANLAWAVVLDAAVRGTRRG